jgi:hypothetical protein
MGRYCGENSSRYRDRRGKTLGIILMAVGVLILLFFVPYWIWTAVLAVLLISIGFLIWRF